MARAGRARMRARRGSRGRWPGRRFGSDSPRPSSRSGCLEPAVCSGCGTRRTGAPAPVLGSSLEEEKVGAAEIRTRPALNGRRGSAGSEAGGDVRGDMAGGTHGASAALGPCGAAVLVCSSRGDGRCSGADGPRISASPIRSLSESSRGRGPGRGSGEFRSPSRSPGRSTWTVTKGEDCLSRSRAPDTGPATLAAYPSGARPRRAMSGGHSTCEASCGRGTARIRGVKRRAGVGQRGFAV